MTPLENRIGYKFRNPLLLAEALTHPSLTYVNREYSFNNQRLEFLGDAVLQLVITEFLFAEFHHLTEGELTKMRARLVSRSGLSRYAKRLELGKYLMMGRGEEASGGRTRASILADAFESLIGAMYLDGDVNTVRAFVLREAKNAITELRRHPLDVNPKGRLQEILQAISSESPVYSIVSQRGAEHEKQFEAKVTWEGLELGRGTGPSKKEAQSSAALQALKLRRWVPIEPDVLHLVPEEGEV